jgi:hypothetical protein
VDVSRANDRSHQILLARRVMLSIAVGLLAAGCNNALKSTLANAPKGQFGNGQETGDYVDGLNFTADSGLVAQYPCKVASDCPPGGIRLMLIPEKHADQRNWQADLGDGAAGDVVAQVVNVDNVVFPDLGLPPGGVAYAWVGQIGSNSKTDRGFGIYRLDNSGKTAGTWSLAWAKDIAFCKNDAARSKPSIKSHHEGGGTCVPIALAGDAPHNGLAWLGIPAAHAAMARSASTAAIGLGQLWISCSGGCCQVSPT